MCLNKDRLSRVINTAFVYNDKIHFFIGENYATFNNEKKELDDFKRISTKFGKLPVILDAAVVYPFDDEVYFFKGAQFGSLIIRRSGSARDTRRKSVKNGRGCPTTLMEFSSRRGKSILWKEVSTFNTAIGTKKLNQDSRRIWTENCLEQERPLPRCSIGPMWIWLFWCRSWCEYV